MSIKLQKGQTLSLKKEAPGLKKVLIGLGWDPAKKGLFFNNDIDVDASVVCLDDQARCQSVVCYKKLQDFGGAIRHYGDNLTGEGVGDDEQVEINLQNIPKKIKKLIIIINIYRALSRLQSFSKVRNCYITVTDINSNKEILNYQISGNFNGKTAIAVAKLECSADDDNSSWRFTAIGEGFRVADIEEMVEKVRKKY